MGIEHRSAEKASLSCVGTYQRSHWSRRKERDPHKTKADKPFRFLIIILPQCYCFKVAGFVLFIVRNHRLVNTCSSEMPHLFVVFVYPPPLLQKSPTSFKAVRNSLNRFLDPSSPCEPKNVNICCAITRCPHLLHNTNGYAAAGSLAQHGHKVVQPHFESRLEFVTNHRGLGRTHNIVLVVGPALELTLDQKPTHLCEKPFLTQRSYHRRRSNESRVADPNGHRISIIDRVGHNHYHDHEIHKAGRSSNY